MTIPELSERERFIYHIGMNAMLGETKGGLHGIIEHVRKHRCRHLTDKDVYELMKLMRDELTTSRIMWEEA